MLICSLILCSMGFVWSQSSKDNTITIDLRDQKANINAAIDFNNPVTLTFENCDLIYAKNIRIGLTYKAQTKPLAELDCNKPFVLDFNKLLGEKPGSGIEISLVADAKSMNDNSFEFTFEVDPSGKLISNTIIPAVKEVLKSDVEFVDPQFFNPVAAPAFDVKGLTRVEYNPCTNKYSVFKSGSTDIEKHIRFYNQMKKNTGVIFLIKDFNTLKYDITVGKEFVSNFTDVPGLFTAAGDLLADLPELTSTEKTKSLGPELALITKLNQDLNEFFKIKMKDLDCICLTDFEDQKSKIIAQIKKEFNIADTVNILDFSKDYRTMRTQHIEKMKETNKDYNSVKFNEDFKKAFGMEMTPDALVQQTRMVLSTLVNTKFLYQYNVPQLQNADKIVFNLSINPKKDVGGVMHMTDELIEIPLRGGWKIDFSTGFYYSNIKNKEFGLRDVIRGDTLSAKEVVDEGGKDFGKHTAGITALMHIYPRMGSVQPALTFGVGKGLDLNYSFVFGGSLLMGRDNRFVISSGYNYSNVKTLSNRYLDVDNNLMEVDKSATSVVNVNRFKRGGFLSLTYSFGAKKVQKAAPVEEKKEEKKE